MFLERDKKVVQENLDEIKNAEEEIIVLARGEAHVRQRTPSTSPRPCETASSPRSL